MRLSIPQYAQALLEIEKGMDESMAAGAGKKFFSWLVRRGEGKKMGKILREADRMVKAQSGVADVVITTAHEAPEETKELLRAQAKEVFAGQSVDVQFATDANLIGGVKMRSESMLYDATLSTSVRKLRTALTR